MARAVGTMALAAERVARAKRWACARCGLSDFVGLSGYSTSPNVCSSQRGWKLRRGANFLKGKGRPRGWRQGARRGLAPAPGTEFRFCGPDSAALFASAPSVTANLLDCGCLARSVQSESPWLAPACMNMDLSLLPATPIVFPGFPIGRGQSGRSGRFPPAPFCTT